MDLYTRQCAIEMNCLELARMGMIFAMNGLDPDSGKQIIPEISPAFVKHLWSHAACTTHQVNLPSKLESRQKAGFPAESWELFLKSSAIGIFGPALDQKGNSIAGMKLLELLSETYQLSMFRGLMHNIAISLAFQISQ